MDTAQIIQYSLTPAVMISSAALFLLGLQNRFSSLFARFRALNQERRSLSRLAERHHDEDERLKNILVQLDQLMQRVRRIKDAITSCYLAVLCFIGTSLCLFLSRYSSLRVGAVAVVTFLAGVLFIFAACLFLIFEVRLAFRILQIERKA